MNVTTYYAVAKGGSLPQLLALLANEEAWPLDVAHAAMLQRLVDNPGRQVAVVVTSHSPLLSTVWAQRGWHLTPVDVWNGEQPPQPRLLDNSGRMPGPDVCPICTACDPKPCPAADQPATVECANCGNVYVRETDTAPAA